MKYNFDEVIPRRGTCSYKWDSAAEDVLPMWVADMDFRAAPAITEALRKRMSHGVFGYTRVPAAYYEAVVQWFFRRHHWKIDPASIIYTSGVVPAISAVIKAFCQPGDGVIVQTPVYNCFYSSIRNNECRLLGSPLIYENNTYRMDFSDLEQKAAEPTARVMLLCNPHNPAGRVWTADELRQVGEICKRHGVIVVSDEIHCELTFAGHDYTPYANIAEEIGVPAVSCISPSKAFNIAGLQIANIVAPDADMRRRIDRAINVNEVCDVNPFGVVATIAAYNEGEDWLEELLKYLWGNYECLKACCAEHLPQLPICTLEGTYLAWMDCSATGLEADVLEERLRDEGKLWLNAGTMYGPGGEHFLRWNLACPRSLLHEGMERFRRFISKL